MDANEHGGSQGSGRARSWEELENCLSGVGDLAELIDQLSTATPGSPGPRPTIREVLGAHLGEVLERGLAGVPAGTLDALVRHPQLLRDLQGLVATAGGDYWRARFDAAAAQLPAEYQAVIERNRKRLADRGERE